MNSDAATMAALATEGPLSVVVDATQWHGKWRIHLYTARTGALASAAD
jgi:hypothetical protein